MSKWLADPTHRRWIYGICIALVPLSVAYGLIDATQGPLWIALAGAIVGPAVALGHMPKPEQEDDHDA